MTSHTLLYVVLVLIVVGVAMYFVNSIIPIDRNWRLVINVIVGIAVALYLLRAFTLISF